MAVCILTFSFIPNDSHFLIKFGARIVFIPFIAGISYEILKFSGRYCGHPLLKIFITPGLWVQKITTKEPDEKQLEIAIISLKAALDQELPENIEIVQ